MRILITETTWDMTRLAHDLDAAGLRLSRLDEGGDVLQALDLGAADAVVLTENLPDMTLRSLLAAIRHRDPALPVAVLAAGTGPADRAALLDRGADIVLDPGMDGAESAARLRALVRRRAGLGSDLLNLGRGLIVDLKRQMVHVGSQRLHLTRLEYALIEALALRPGRIVPREMLMSLLYDGLDSPHSRIVDVYLSRLRAAIAAAGSDPTLIETHVGRGFLLAPRPVDGWERAARLAA